MDRSRRPPRYRARTLEPSLEAPAEIRASGMRLGSQEYVVLSYPVPVVALPEQLTTAEREVAMALLAGEAYAQIAARRRTALRTVANQVASIFRKAGVRSRLELAVRLSGPPAGGGTEPRK